MRDATILVGYDGSAGAAVALRWAAVVARRTGNRLHLVHILHQPLLWPVSGTDPASGRRGPAEQLLAGIAADLAAGVGGGGDPAGRRIQVTSQVEEGDPAARLTTLSRGAGLVVLGHRGHGQFSGLLLGSVGVAVTAHAHCPVAIVRGEHPTSGAGRPVAVGSDGSPAADAALGFAFGEAAARRVDLVAIRAWQPPPPPWQSVVRPLVLDVDELETAERSELTGALAGWREKYPDVVVEPILAVGSPAEAMVSASRRAQLIVVGARGRGGFAGLLLGSVSQQVIHHAACPVVVVREEGGRGGPTAG
jgi:nucleotide-binding universal stress UspA family protein